MRAISRRAFLARSAGVTAALASLCDARRACGSEAGEARFVRLVPLGRLDGRPAPTPGVIYGSGLDARRFVDLSRLDERSLITPAEQFFIRTAKPTQLEPVQALKVGMSPDHEISLPLDALGRFERDMGVHLLECAGNTDPANFGLIGAARWRGVPLGAIVDLAPAQPSAPRILVEGDDPAGSPRSSVVGASWIFSRDDIERTGAFIASGMNGAPLSAEHGHPLRLIVPGWYGCASIKWLRHVRFVGHDEPATSQMREFALRTHQEGTPSLARDYAPPVVDVAATAIRVEQWIASARSFYRVVGVAWGGTRPARALQIRFKHTDPFLPVERYSAPASTATWCLWSHTWRPAVPGRYRIVLRAADDGVRTRRLDAFFYTREVDIDAI